MRLDPNQMFPLVQGLLLAKLLPSFCCHPKMPPEIPAPHNRKSRGTVGGVKWGNHILPVEALTWTHAKDHTGTFNQLSWPY